MSNDLAQTQARVLEVELLTIPIGPPFAGFLDVLKPAFAALGSQPSALTAAADVTEENLQSRCRGVILMALSNKFGKMLLSTGNKSEMAVGYATIYGDMCGGYAPLKDCYKQLVYALARWRNAQDSGPRAEGRGPEAQTIPQAVIDRAPSAELRDNQTDQDSLPPYAVLDAILERFIEGEQSQAEIIAAGFDAATVRRIARLVLASEHKRRQSAPGPKISTRAFGRDRRYPISSGWI
jgi:NAD+ synthetase